MLNEEIKKLRKNLGLSQEKFAEELGVVQRTVSAWESGQNEPTISTLMLIFKKYKITPNQLIFGDNDLFFALLTAYNIAKENKVESELTELVNSFIHKKWIEKWEKKIRSFKGTSFAQKLAEAWGGKGERMLIVLYYFIDHLEKFEFEKFDKPTLIETLQSFNIPKKIRLKHLFSLKNEDKENLIKWVNENLDELDAGTLLIDLPKTKELIKEELNYINRFIA